MTALVCGTGGWGGPKPGDPDNNVTLSATPAFGGIDVTWTYPGVNPHAVAHTILYRSTSGTEADPVQHHIVSGSFFYDKTTTATPVEYFYWIRIVSVNGTVGDLIGPASATARPTIEEVMRDLTGKIDSGLLAQTLKESINEIDLTKKALYDEMKTRAANDASLAVAYEEFLARSNQTLALLQEERVARTEADSAFVESVNTLYAQVDNDLASVQINMDAFVKHTNGKLTDIGSLYTAKVNVNGLVGGFGVYNDGTQVEAGFDVDRFWLGRTATDGIKPFIMEGEEVFIKEAVIKSLTFNKLRADNGSLIVENGKVKADYLSVGEASIIDGSITNAKIKNGAITSAKIGDAEITSAKIGHAQVDTLQIKGDAVTVPRAYYGTSCYHDFQGSGGLIFFACHISANNDASVYVTLNVDGSAVHSQQVRIRADSGVEADFNLPIILIHALTGINGVRNVSASFTGSWHTVVDAKFVVMSAKR